MGGGRRSTGTGRVSYGDSGNMRVQSSLRYSATDRREIGVDKERVRVLERKIEREKRENMLMNALNQSDRVSSLLNYNQKAGELNNRIATTYFKPLYIQQVPRSDSFNFQKRHNNPLLSSDTNNKIHFENNISKVNKSAVPATSNMFLSYDPYSPHKNSLKPTSFVDATKNMLDTSTRSKSFNAAEIKIKSTRSLKSSLSKKKNNKSTISIKGDKSIISKKGNKCTISKKSKVSKPNLSTISKRSKKSTIKPKISAPKEGSENVSVTKSKPKKVNTNSSLVNPLISRMSEKGTGKAVPKSKLLKIVLMNSRLRATTADKNKAAVVSSVIRT